MPGVAEKKTDKHPEIRELLIALIERYKAGSPTQEGVYWISLKLERSFHMAFMICWPIKVTYQLGEAAKRQALYWTICFGGGGNMG